MAQPTRLILGAVLAGGQSRRFGSDKAVAELGGRTLIDLAIEALSRHVDAVVVCGRRVPGFECLGDRPYGIGPLGAINAALHHAGDNGFAGVLTTGCDMPVFPADAARRLTVNGPSVVAGQRLAGYWPAALAVRLDAYLAATSDRSMGAWATAAGAATVTLNTPIPNINTPDDLAALAAARAT